MLSDDLAKQINGKSLPGAKAGSVLECDDCGNFTDCYKITSWGKIKALLQKNFLRMWRNIGYVDNETVIDKTINNKIFVYTDISVLDFLKIFLLKEILFTHILTPKYIIN